MEDIKTVVKNIAKITFLIIANLFGDLQCKVSSSNASAQVAC